MNLPTLRNVLTMRTWAFAEMFPGGG